MWIKYFEGNGKPITLPPDTDVFLASLVNLITNPSIPKEKIYDLSEPAIENREYLLDLFGYNRTIQRERYELIRYLSANCAIIETKNRIWNCVSKVVMQTLFHFFFQFFEACSRGGSVSDHIEDFSPEFVGFVNVSLHLPKGKIDDVIEMVNVMFQKMVLPMDGLPSEPRFRGFVMECCRCALLNYRLPAIASAVRTTFFHFIVRYFVAATDQIHQVMLSTNELTVMVESVDFFMTTIVKFKRVDFEAAVELIVDVVLRLFQNILGTKHLNYDLNMLYLLGVKSFDLLATLLDPSRMVRRSIAEKPEIVYVVLFGMWCLDCYGFVAATIPQYPFVKERIPHTDTNRFEFRDYHTPIDEDGIKSWGFVDASVQSLHMNCTNALDKIVALLRTVAPTELCLDVIWRLFAPEGSCTDFVFQHPELVGFYVLFIVCYFTKQVNCQREIVNMLDDCFHPAIFEVVSELGSEEYGKRVFFRNYLFQVLRDVASYNMRDTVLKLLAMFNSPISVGLEIVSFLGDLVDVYGDQCIECLSLSAVFELDRALQYLELPGREYVFHFLYKLVQRPTGICLLVSHDGYIHRLLECTFDNRVVAHSFALLRACIEQVTEIDSFSRLLVGVKEVLSQAVQEDEDQWKLYLPLLLPVLSDIFCHFRLLFSSSDGKFPILISLLVDLAEKMAKVEAINVVSCVICVIKSLVSGDSRYRSACAKFYSLNLLPTRVYDSIIDDILGLVYEAPSLSVSDSLDIKNPDALGLLHHSLFDHPDVHHQTFKRVFEDMDTMLHDQVALSNSNFIKDMFQFMHDFPNHKSYEVFSETVSMVLSNLFHMQFFTAIPELGMTPNWETIITRVSEMKASEIALKPFVYLQGGDTDIVVKCRNSFAVTLHIQFAIPHQPLTDTSVLLSFRDKDGRGIDIFVKRDCFLYISIHTRSDEFRESQTAQRIVPGTEYNLDVSLANSSVVVSIFGGVRVEVRCDFPTSPVFHEIAIGKSLVKRNSSIAVIVYQISMINDGTQVFYTDCSTAINDLLLNMVDYVDSPSVVVTGHVYPRRVTLAEPLLRHGGLFDLVKCAKSENSVVFLVKILKNLVVNEPSFEYEFFEMAKETSFLYSFLMIDRSLITMDYVHELYSLTNSIKEEANRFMIYDVCWFSFEIWNDSSVYDYVYEQTIPMIMQQNPQYVDKHLHIARFFVESADLRSFWHVVCLYLLQSKRETDFRELKTYVHRHRPRYFFMNLFGVCYLTQSTHMLLCKLDKDDMILYYQLFFSHCLEEDISGEVTESVFDPIISLLQSSSSLPIVFDIAMLLVQCLPSKYLLRLVKVSCQNDEVFRKVLESQQLSIWMTCIILRQCEDNIDVRSCDPDIIKFLSLMLEKSPGQFREFAAFFMVISANYQFDSSVIFRAVYMETCNNILQEKIEVDVDTIAVVAEYLCFVTRSEVYSRNLALSVEFGEEVSLKSSVVKPITLRSCLEFVMKRGDASSMFLTNRQRISEDGKWIDEELAALFLKVLKGRLEQEISFSANQEILIDHLCAYIIQLLLITNSRNLEQVSSLVSETFGDSVSDLSVRLILYGAFKFQLKNPRYYPLFCEFLMEFRSNLDEDGEMNNLPHETEEDLMRIIGSSYAESNYMWMRCIDNFCVATYTKQNAVFKTIYQKFPFADEQFISLANIDTVPICVQKWVNLCHVETIMESRKKMLMPNLPLLDARFQPICTGRAPIVLYSVPIAGSILREDLMLCSVTVRVFDTDFQSFFYCDPFIVVFSGVKVNVEDVTWIVGRSDKQIEFYIENGVVFLLTFESNAAREHVYNFLTSSKLLVVSGLTNMDLVVRFNIMHGNSYNTTQKVVFPILKDSSFSETKDIGSNWHFLKQIVNMTDLTEWFSSHFSSKPFAPALVRDICDLNHSVTPLFDACFVAINKDHVIALISESLHSSAILVMSHGPKFKVVSRMRLKLGFYSGTKLCFFDETTFLYYTASSKTVKILRRDPDSDEPKLIYSMSIDCTVHAFLKIDSRRAIIHLSDDVFYHVSLENDTANLQPLFIGQTKIVTSSVNSTLNLLATIDTNGNVILTSLTTFSFIKSLSLSLTGVTGMKLLTSGVIAISERDNLQSFDLDSVCLCRTNGVYKIAGVIGDEHEVIAVVNESNDIILMDPFNLYAIKRFTTNHPIRRFCSETSLPSALLYDGRMLVQITIQC